MNQCLTCKTELTDIYHRFCCGICQRISYESIERKIKMNHLFMPSQLDKSKCDNCDRTLIDHTKLARCESCNSRGTCDVIDGILLCESCQEKHLINRKDVLVTAEQVINDARKIDVAITDNGSLFNAKVVAFIDIKKAIFADDSIPANDKNVKFQNVLADRYAHLKEVVFKLDTEKHEAVTEQFAIATTLRDLGNELREETRAKIQELDKQYQPIKSRPVTPKIPKNTKSAFDRLVETVMMMKEVDRKTAEELLKKGGMGK